MGLRTASSPPTYPGAGTERLGQTGLLSRQTVRGDVTGPAVDVSSLQAIVSIALIAWQRPKLVRAPSIDCVHCAEEYFVPPLTTPHTFAVFCR